MTMDDTHANECFVCGRRITIDGSDTVRAQRVIYAVTMSGTRQDVRGPQVLFHRGCFAHDRGLWVEIP
jgi:hypothetical protein